MNFPYRAFFFPCNNQAEEQFMLFKERKCPTKYKYITDTYFRAFLF